MSCIVYNTWWWAVTQTHKLTRSLTQSVTVSLTVSVTLWPGLNHVTVWDALSLSLDSGLKWSKWFSENWSEGWSTGPCGRGHLAWAWALPSFYNTAKPKEPSQAKWPRPQPQGPVGRSVAEARLAVWPGLGLTTGPCDLGHSALALLTVSFYNSEKGQVQLTAATGRQGPVAWPSLRLSLGLGDTCVWTKLNMLM